MLGVGVARPMNPQTPWTQEADGASSSVTPSHPRTRCKPFKVTSSRQERSQEEHEERDSNPIYQPENTSVGPNYQPYFPPKVDGYPEEYLARLNIRDGRSDPPLPRIDHFKTKKEILPRQERRIRRRREVLHLVQGEEGDDEGNDEESHEEEGVEEGGSSSSTRIQNKAVLPPQRMLDPEADNPENLNVILSRHSDLYAKYKTDRFGKYVRDHSKRAQVMNHILGNVDTWKTQAGVHATYLDDLDKGEGTVWYSYGNDQKRLPEYYRELRQYKNLRKRFRERQQSFAKRREWWNENGLQYYQVEKIPTAKGQQRVLQKMEEELARRKAALRAYQRERVEDDVSSADNLVRVKPDGHGFRISQSFCDKVENRLYSQRQFEEAPPQFHPNMESHNLDKKSQGFRKTRDDSSDSANEIEPRAPRPGLYNIAHHHYNFIGKIPADRPVRISDYPGPRTSYSSPSP